MNYIDTLQSNLELKLQNMADCICDQLMIRRLEIGVYLRHNNIEDIENNNSEILFIGPNFNSVDISEIQKRVPIGVSSSIGLLNYENIYQLDWFQLISNYSSVDNIYFMSKDAIKAINKLELKKNPIFKKFKFLNFPNTQYCFETKNVYKFIIDGYVPEYLFLEKNILTENNIIIEKRISDLNDYFTEKDLFIKHNINRFAQQELQSFLEVLILVAHNIVGDK
jgi:hypothetical protein